MYRDDNNYSGARHLRAACCCVLMISLIAGTPAMAASAPEPIVVNSTSDTVAPSVLSLARRQVEDMRLWQTPPSNSATANQPTSQSNESQKKKALIIGLVGAGTAVAGIFVWRGDSGPNLPGITSGRKLTGQLMVGGGGALAVLGLMAAFK